MEAGRELFERYLQAVRKYLPWKGQNDIVNELRANLEAQIEEREEELGRRLTEGEMLDWLKQLGSPMQVAARYRALQYLIGPALFPMYVYVLRIALLWSAAIYTVATIVRFAVGIPDAGSVVATILRIPEVLFTAGAWVTLAFAALEAIFARNPALCPPITGVSPGWSPSSLPPLEKPHEEGKRSRSYAMAVAEVVFGYIFLVWLLLIPHYPFLLMGPGIYALRATPYWPGPVWTEFYWIVVALNLLQLAWNSLALWRRRWEGPRTAYQVMSKTFGLIALSVLLFARDHAYLVLRHAEPDQAQHGAKLVEINIVIWHGLQIVSLIVVIQWLWEIARTGTKAFRARRAARPMNASRQNGY